MQILGGPDSQARVQVRILFLREEMMQITKVKILQTGQNNRELKKMHIVGKQDIFFRVRLISDSFAGGNEISNKPLGMVWIDSGIWYD